MKRCFHLWRNRFVYFSDGSRCCVKCACKRFAKRATLRARLSSAVRRGDCAEAKRLTAEAVRVAKK